ncbi:MAG: GAF domain-containing protein [Magnetococcales bacterium]|nr:GAF domain-containing protein [Magnetococcales bacterium]
MIKKQELGQRLKQLVAWQECINKNWHPTQNRELLEFFMEILASALDAERCSIFIHDPVSDGVWLKCGTGLEERAIVIPKTGSNVGKVIATGQSISITTEEEKSSFARKVEIVTGFTTRNMLCVPIKSPNRDEIPGAIQLLNKRGTTANEGFTEADRIVLEKAARHLGMVIENIYLGQEFVEITGKLTGRIDVAEWIIKLWIGFMGVVIAVAFGIIIYFTPHILHILQR